MRAFSISGVSRTHRLTLDRFGRLAAICLAITTWFGCGRAGPQRVAVSGNVRLDGHPVESGIIQFLPVKGTVGPETGAVITDGQYDIPRQRGPIIGKNRVELRASSKTGRKIQDPTGRPGVLTDEYKELFPEAANTNSSLVREINDETKTLDFDIRTK
jgi:hypothetical protein